RATPVVCHHATLPAESTPLEQVAELEPRRLVTAEPSGDHCKIRVVRSEMTTHLSATSSRRSSSPRSLCRSPPWSSSAAGLMSLDGRSSGHRFSTQDGGQIHDSPQFSK